MKKALKYAKTLKELKEHIVEKVKEARNSSVARTSSATIDLIHDDSEDDKPSDDEPVSALYLHESGSLRPLTRDRQKSNREVVDRARGGPLNVSKRREAPSLLSDEKIELIDSEDETKETRKRRRFPLPTTTQSILYPTTTSDASLTGSYLQPKSRAAKVSAKNTSRCLLDRPPTRVRPLFIKSSLTVEMSKHTLTI